MLVIRLQRTGRENRPAYRIVLSEKARHAKKGVQEIFGHYLPAETTPVFECDQQRVTYWVRMGARPSDTIARLLKKAGMKDMEKFMDRYAKQKSKSAQAADAVEAEKKASSDAKAKAEQPKTEQPKADELKA